MADSRRYAQFLLGKVFQPFLARLSSFTGVLGLCLLITWLFAPDDLTQNQVYVFFLLFFAIGLWFTEAIPPFAVGILILVYLVYFLGSPVMDSEPMDVSKYVNTWSSPVIWLLLGGFFLAESLKKSRLDTAILRRVLSTISARPPMVLLGLMTLSLIGSMIMSNTATTAMILATVVPLCRNLGKEEPFSKAILLGVPTAAAVGGMGTIIGTPSNAIAVGALNTTGGDVSFGMWMIYGIVPAVLLTFLTWRFLLFAFKTDRKKIELSPSVKEETEDAGTGKAARRISVVTLLLTVGLWITTPLHGFPVSAIAAIPLVSLTVSGVINAQDLQRMPWDTLMLVSGGLALGLSLQETGLAERFVSTIEGVDLPLIPMIAILCFVTMVLSNVMSNTAASTIIVPLAILLLPENAEFAAVAIALSASTALFLPVSTPPNALAYATGMLEQSDFRNTGIIIGISGPAVVIAWVYLVQYLL
ncbi:MAG: DASS family sodium-coupled anion symporter [Flavobacteriales bacterium]|nr:DASS family sodium-coupled anion symporter [Flavobacteriales bacterium]